MLYILDANILIDAKRTYYQFDRVPEFWAWLAHMGVEGRVKVPVEVYDKLTDAKDDDLADWLRVNKNAMLFSEDVEPGLIAYAHNRGYGGNLTEDDIEKLNEDPFLIAYALADRNNRCVVTTEVSKPRRQGANRHIPDVCMDLGVSCCNTFTFIQELDFRTDWNAG